MFITHILKAFLTTKDKDPVTKKSGVIYRYKCDRVEYDEEYIRGIYTDSCIMTGCSGTTMQRTKTRK